MIKSMVISMFLLIATLSPTLRAESNIEMIEIFKSEMEKKEWLKCSEILKSSFKTGDSMTIESCEDIVKIVAGVKFADPDQLTSLWVILEELEVLVRIKGVTITVSEVKAASSIILYAAGLVSHESDAKKRSHYIHLCINVIDHLHDVYKQLLKDLARSEKKKKNHFVEIKKDGTVDVKANDDSVAKHMLFRLKVGISENIHIITNVVKSDSVINKKTELHLNKVIGKINIEWR